MTVRNPRALILDPDRQGTALQWRAGRDGAGPEVLARDAAELGRTMEVEFRSYDFIIIDRAGRDEPSEAFAAAYRHPAGCGAAGKQGTRTCPVSNAQDSPGEIRRAGRMGQCGTSKE
jgi:hypothetical protein